MLSSYNKKDFFCKYTTIFVFDFLTKKKKDLIKTFLLFCFNVETFQNPHIITIMEESYVFLKINLKRLVTHFYKTYKYVCRTGYSNYYLMCLLFTYSIITGIFELIS